MPKSIAEIHNININGKGTQPMVFAHGLGCDQSIWRYVAPYFEESYKVVLFDYIGSGKSDYSYYENERHNSLKGYAQDVLRICNELNLKEIIFVGHSVSAMIGLIAAIEQPALFSNLVMIAPTACYLNDHNYRGGFEIREIELLLKMMEDNYSQWASYIAPVVIGNPMRKDLEDEMEDRFCIADHEITKKFATINFWSDNRGIVPELQTPTLVMECDEDVLVTPEAGKFLQNNLQHGELISMKAKGHCPHLVAPEETINSMRDYLKDH